MCKDRTVRQGAILAAQGCVEFCVIQPDPGTFLVRGHQRRCSSPGDGPDDASHRRYKGHGPIYSDGRPALYGLAGDRRHGRCGRWDAHYGSHVARLAGANMRRVSRENDFQ